MRKTGGTTLNSAFFVLQLTNVLYPPNGFSVNSKFLFPVSLSLQEYSL